MRYCASSPARQAHRACPSCRPRQKTPHPHQTSVARRSHRRGSPSATPAKRHWPPPARPNAPERGETSPRCAASCPPQNQKSPPPPDPRPPRRAARPAQGAQHLAHLKTRNHALTVIRHRRTAHIAHGIDLQPPPITPGHIQHMREQRHIAQNRAVGIDPEPGVAPSRNISGRQLRQQPGRRKLGLMQKNLQANQLFGSPAFGAGNLLAIALQSLRQSPDLCLSAASTSEQLSRPLDPPFGGLPLGGQGSAIAQTLDLDLDTPSTLRGFDGSCHWGNSGAPHVQTCAASAFYPQLRRANPLIYIGLCNERTNQNT